MLSNRANKENAGGGVITVNQLQSPMRGRPLQAQHNRSNSCQVLSPKMVLHPQPTPYRSIPLTGTPAVFNPAHRDGAAPPSTLLPPPTFTGGPFSPATLDMEVDHLNQSLVGRDEVNALQAQVSMLQQQLVAFEMMDRQGQKTVTGLNAKIAELGSEIADLKARALVDKQIADQNLTESRQTIASLNFSLSQLQLKQSEVESRYATLQKHHTESIDATNYNQLQVAHQKLTQEHTIIVRQHKASKTAANPMSVVFAHAKACNGCNKSFALFTRRHHCRSCGDSICSSCSVDKSMLVGGGKKAVRACKPCIQDAAGALVASKAKRAVAAEAVAPPPAPAMAPPPAPPMIPCAPPMAPPMSAPVPPTPARAAGLGSPRPSPISRQGGFDPSTITSVTLRPTRTVAATPSRSLLPRDSILADIKSYQSARKTRLQQTPARTIAKTTSPSNSAKRSGSKRKGSPPSDMMAHLRSQVAMRRYQIEHGSDCKSSNPNPASARRSTLAVRAALDAASDNVDARPPVKRGLSFTAPVKAAASSTPAPSDADQIKPIAVNEVAITVGESTNAISSTIVEENAMVLSPIAPAPTEDVDDSEWTD